MDESVRKALDVFFEKYKTQKYKKGELLIRAGDKPPGVFYLKEGRVKEYAISQKGDELTVNIFKPNAFFPMSWAINGTKNEYFFEAIDNLEVIRASKNDVLQFIKSNTNVLYDLLSRVYKGTDGILTRMTYLMVGSAYLRLIEELLTYGKRFGVKNGSVITIKTTERDIASQTGMTRETVSREMKSLKEKGLLTFSRNEIVINGVEKLGEELALGF